MLFNRAVFLVTDYTLNLPFMSLVFPYHAYISRDNYGPGGNQCYLDWHLCQRMPLLVYQTMKNLSPQLNVEKALLPGLE